MHIFEPTFWNALDSQILIIINGIHSGPLDTLMWWLSDRWIWIPFYLALTAFLIRRFGWGRGVACLLFIAALITMVDQTCSSLIRPAVCRMRPSNPDNPISVVIHVVNDYRGGSYGFPSSHAGNTFALAVFLSLLFRNRGLAAVLFVWSVAVSYSRMYLGVHYPGDILAGFAVGGFYAVMCYQLMIRFAIRREEMRRCVPVTYRFMGIVINL